MRTNNREIFVHWLCSVYNTLTFYYTSLATSLVMKHTLYCSFKTCFLILLLFSCVHAVSAQPPSLIDTPEQLGTHPMEAELFALSDAYIDTLKSRNLILEDQELVDYLYSVTDRLLPGQREKTPWKIYVITDLATNASAAPNGVITITTGLLLRFDKEAQLAFILAHELSHFLYRHSLMQKLAGQGLNPRFKIHKKKKQMAFSRELEWDADSKGMEMYAAAGYPKEQADEALKRMPPEMNISWIFSKYFRTQDGPNFRTHPRTPERVNKLKELSERLEFSSSNNEPDQYLEMTKNVNLTTRKYMIDKLNATSNAMKARQIDSLLKQLELAGGDEQFKLDMQLAQADAWLNLISLPDRAAAIEIDADERVANYRAESNEAEEKVYQIDSPMKMFMYDKDLYQSRITKIRDRLINTIEIFDNTSSMAAQGKRLRGVLYYEDENFAEAKPLLQAYLDQDQSGYQRRYIRSLIRTIDSEKPKKKKKKKGRRN